MLLPIPASAEESEAVPGSRAGEAVAPGVDLGGELQLIRGVTTAGDPGPRSMRLSSVASFNIWKGGKEKSEELQMYITVGFPSHTKRIHWIY